MNKEDILCFEINESIDTNIRLDIYIKNHTTFSRTYIGMLIEEGNVSVNNKTVKKSSYKTKICDKITVKKKEIETLDIIPENLPLKILYEDDDILIIDKERGMVVHPSNGHFNNTLVNAIMYHCKDNLSSINGIVRPGIVHRIDKDTSGILCICKNDISHKNIALQFASHTNIRKYKAIVRGIIKQDDGYIDKPIGRDKRNRLKMAIDLGGKEAKTYYKVIKRFYTTNTNSKFENGYTYIECELFTGRTHQIRVHMKDLGNPLLGDLIYGKLDKDFKELDGQILHAYYLEINHPTTGERIKFESEIPHYFKNVLDNLYEKERRKKEKY